MDEVQLADTERLPEWYAAGPVNFAAFGDRLLILEDAFKSGYECRACGGKGTIRCNECGGFGSYTRNGNSIKCSQCSGTGKLKCSECEGKGGLLVVPEQSQRRPSTGRVVSTGDKVKYFHVGDDVLYSNFAGHAMDLPLESGQVCLRILHESEILAQVKGHLELRAVRNQKEALGVG